MNQWDIRAIKQWAEEFEDEVTVFLATFALVLALALIIAELMGINI